MTRLWVYEGRMDESGRELTLAAEGPDFSGTGMTFEEVNARVRDIAKIAVSPGPSFGAGGETFMRVNIAAPRAIIEEAGTRLQKAFADLQ